MIKVNMKEIKIDKNLCQVIIHRKFIGSHRSEVYKRRGEAILQRKCDKVDHSGRVTIELC